MAENVYEGLFIFDANKFARDQTGLPNAVDKMITEAGGELLVSRLWEERRLAYPIRGQRKGTYWLMYFRLDGVQLKAINRQCELYEPLLRHLVLKVHPRLVEPILAHAQGEIASEDAPTESEEGTTPQAATEETPAEATA